MRKSTDTPRPPKVTEREEEKRLISLATQLAARQLEEGKASSQVITHFLKLGSSVATLEREILEEEIRLKRAKTEVLEANKRIEELYEKALRAMGRYSGQPQEDVDDD